MLGSDRHISFLGHLNLVEFTSSLYLLNGFVHFLSSLDVSELAKAAKKKLQSVSISSWWTPAWKPCWSLLSVWVSSCIRWLLNQKEAVRSICSNEDKKLLGISKSADYFRQSVFFSLVLKMQPLPVVVGYCFLPEFWLFLRVLEWVRWPSMAFLPLVTWDGTLRNSNSWHCQGNELVHSSTGVLWTLSCPLYAIP